MAADDDDWDVPLEAQPKPSDYGFDLDHALRAVVTLTARIPPEAYTAETLGTERAGSAVVIGRDNLVLTIGYLVVEANEIWLTTGMGRVVAAHLIGYDFVTGFGLLQAQGPLDCPFLPLGDSRIARPGDRVVLAGPGGRGGSIAAHIIARQQFAGYWEYLLDDAIFTAPAHPHWAGTALIGPAGELWAIGSLQVPHQIHGEQVVPLNMLVPIEAFLPIFKDLTSRGRANRPPRPSLGLFSAETSSNDIVIAGLAGEGPAQRAGLREGDIVLAVDDREVKTLSDFYKAIWALGEAGVEVPLRLDREGDVFDVRIASADRELFLIKSRLH